MRGAGRLGCLAIVAGLTWAQVSAQAVDSYRSQFQQLQREFGEEFASGGRGLKELGARMRRLDEDASVNGLTEDATFFPSLYLALGVCVDQEGTADVTQIQEKTLPKVLDRLGWFKDVCDANPGLLEDGKVREVLGRVADCVREEVKAVLADFLPPADGGTFTGKELSPIDLAGLQGVADAPFWEKLHSLADGHFIDLKGGPVSPPTPEWVQERVRLAWAARQAQPTKEIVADASGRRTPTPVSSRPKHPPTQRPVSTAVSPTPSPVATRVVVAEGPLEPPVPSSPTAVVPAAPPTPGSTATVPPTPTPATNPALRRLLEGPLSVRISKTGLNRLRIEVPEATGEILRGVPVSGTASFTATGTRVFRQQEFKTMFPAGRLVVEVKIDWKAPQDVKGGVQLDLTLSFGEGGGLTRTFRGVEVEK